MDLVDSLRTRLGAGTVSRLAPWEHDAVVDAAALVGRGEARVHVAGNTVLVGPWDTTGRVDVCGVCVHDRWLRVRGAAQGWWREAAGPGTGTSASGRPWPLDTSFAVDAIELLLRRVTSVQAPPTAPPAPDGCAYLTSLDLVTLRTSTVLVERDPLCPHCSTWSPDTPDAPDGARVRSRPSPSGSRITPVEQYDLVEDALVNAAAGVLGASAHEDVRSTSTAPVVGQVDARSARPSSTLTWSGQTSSYARSRVVGMLEGLERYAGAWRRRPLSPVVASYEDVAEHAVDPRDLGLYPPETYAAQPGLTPFDPSRRIPWVWGRSLRDDRPVLVAQRNVFYASPPGADRFVDECSNGCASGSCYEEAVVHGLLEVVERDAFLLAWYSGRRLPRLVGGGGDRVASSVDRAGLLGYDVALLDTTSDVGVPVVTALATRRDGGDGCVVLASGASLDPVEAAEAALGEVLTYLPGRQEQTRRRRAELQGMAADYALVTQLRDHAELFGLPEMRDLAVGLVGADAPVPSGDGPRRRPTPAGRAWSGDLAEDLRELVAAVAALGHDVVVVEQTSPEQARRGIAAVRVMAPGLLPIDFGWSRQRALRMPRLWDSADPAAVRRVPHPFP